MQVQSLGWEDLLEEKMQPTPVFLLGKSHSQRRLAGYSPSDLKSQRLSMNRMTHTHCSLCLCRSGLSKLTIIYHLMYNSWSQKLIQLCFDLQQVEQSSERFLKDCLLGYNPPG